jgi:hypothetical protein
MPPVDGLIHGIRKSTEGKSCSDGGSRTARRPAGGTSKTPRVADISVMRVVPERPHG